MLSVVIEIILYIKSEIESSSGNSYKSLYTLYERIHFFINRRGFYILTIRNEEELYLLY
jgi:hypothetical protein